MNLNYYIFEDIYIYIYIYIHIYIYIIFSLSDFWNLKFPKMTYTAL
jgi:hypothetical protein